MHHPHSDELTTLIRLLKDIFGFDFSGYAASSFSRRVARHMQNEKLNDMDALTDKLLRFPNYFDHFIFELTIGVTEMFRDPGFWAELKEQTVPTFSLKRDKISIWNAGCSTGEEAYSTAILLHESGLHENAEILATDLNAKALHTAQSGQIPANNMYANAQNYLKAGGNGNLGTYFTVQESGALIQKHLLSSISFQRHNLVNSAFPKPFDLILCRNVLIYFNPQLQNQVIAALAECLKPNGLLAFGANESLLSGPISAKFDILSSEHKLFKLR